MRTLPRDHRRRPSPRLRLASQSVKRFVGNLRPSAAAQPCGIIVTDPGQEAEVDYGGDTVPVRDPATGNYRRARLFVLTLGYSRKCIRLQTLGSSTCD